MPVMAADQTKRPLEAAEKPNAVRPRPQTYGAESQTDNRLSEARLDPDFARASEVMNPGFEVVGCMCWYQTVEHGWRKGIVEGVVERHVRGFSKTFTVFDPVFERLLPDWHPLNVRVLLQDVGQRRGVPTWAPAEGGPEHMEVTGVIVLLEGEHVWVLCDRGFRMWHPYSCYRRKGTEVGLELFVRVRGVLHRAEAGNIPELTQVSVVVEEVVPFCPPAVAMPPIAGRPFESKPQPRPPPGPPPRTAPPPGGPPNELPADRWPVSDCDARMLTFAAPPQHALEGIELEMHGYTEPRGPRVRSWV
eukprot:TRINITY_DN15738_c0_g1_i2.p1 TRINITY_DN15738_c0_g1~~TRINITY_DN15738_c0_g1_i2.p1  ORF type:complete len:304 (+),score=35.69 TRINITY_DN15738_c0_g1_i2:57-968(+)